MLHHSEMDAVLIASPPWMHVRHAVQALEAGLDVLVEKPMAVNPEEAESLRTVHRRTGGTLRVGLNRRFLPAYLHLRQAIRAHGSTWTEAMVSFSFPAKQWGAYSSLGGPSGQVDVLDDVGSHVVDLVSWMQGGGIVEARGAAIGEGRTTARFELRFVDGQWAQCEASHGPRYWETVKISATGGTFCVESWTFDRRGPGVESPPIRARVRAWLGRKSRRVLGLPDPMMQSFIGEWEDFAVACVAPMEQGEGATIEDGWRTVCVLEAIRRSQMTGGDWVRVSGKAAPARGPSEDASRPLARPRAPQASEDPSDIDVSIVLVIGNQRERAARTLRALLSQDGIERTEILLLDAGTERAKPLPGSDHPVIRVLHQDRTVSFGEMRAHGARLARGTWIAFIEEHCLPLEGWLASARSVFDGPWVAIGGEMHSANPGIGVSDATAMVNYGDWRPPSPRGDSRLLPGHNVFYRREILMQYEPHLGEMLQAEAVLHMRMTEAGHRLRFEPSIRFGHLNETDLRLICRSYWYWHRSFGGVRARDGAWGWGTRLARAFTTPLVPVVRVFRLIRSALAGRPRDLEVLFRFLPTILLILACASLGLGTGYLMGTGRAPAEFVRCELDVERKAGPPTPS